MNILRFRNFDVRLVQKDIETVLIQLKYYSFFLLFNKQKKKDKLIASQNKFTISHFTLLAFYTVYLYGVYCLPPVRLDSNYEYFF